MDSERKYTVNGEPIDLDEFFKDNEDLFCPEDRVTIESIGITDTINFGGGAGMTLTVQRVA